MNFKKIAVLVAMMAATSAFAVTDYDVTANLEGASVQELAIAEFAEMGAIAGDGNVAFINQEGSSNLAFIDQAGASNFASIVQVNDGALAVVYQVGDTNRAAIYQH
ncbi:MAG: hypothetical protein HQ446_09280 [Polaromonas sp.]|nr:hypothetical protein [Polaromonas sp.]